MKTIKYLFMLATVLLFAACVEDEVYQGPSKIETVQPSISAPTSLDDVTITVTASGLQSIQSAFINYSINGGEVQKAEMTGEGQTFSGKIPAQPDGTNVKYTVTVINTAGFATTSNEFEYTVGDPAPDYTKLVINELYGAGADNEKFIELYNNGDFPIKLKGVKIMKDETDAWEGIAGEVIQPKSTFAIIGAKGTTERGFSSGFSAKKSVLIELFDPNGNKLDQFQRGEKGTGWGSTSLANVTGSWSRVPDGTGKFIIVDTPTPNAANATTGTEDPTVVQ